MKQALNFSPVFNPAARTLDFSGYSGFDPKRLIAVINIDRNAIIYATGRSDIGLSSISGSTITLIFNTTSHNAADRLTVLYDDVNLGYANDTAASSDTGSFSLLAFVKRGMQNWTTLLDRIPALVSGRVPVDASGTTVTVTGPLTDTELRASAVPVSGPLTDTQLRASAVPVSAASLPLPTGAATAANQSTANSSLASIDGKFSSLGQKVMASSAPVVIASDQSPIPITGSITSTNSANGNTGSAVPAEATQVAGRDGSGNLRALSVSASGVLDVAGPLTDTQLRATPVPITGSISVANNANGTPGSAVPSEATQVGGRDGSGNLRALSVSTSGVLDVQASSLPLPTGAATETTLAAINGKLPNIGPQTSANSQSITFATNIPSLAVVENAITLDGAPAQTAVVNNILTDPSGAAATASENFRSASVQIVSTGTGGTFIFEQSNDNVNFVALPVFNAALVTGVPITGAITATASQIIYTFPVRARFVRLRIATTITGGSIRAFSRFSTEPWTAAAQLVASNTAANNLVTANIAASQTLATVTTVSAVTAANLALPGILTDVASAAITTTATTAAFSPTFGTGYIVNIPVTATSGTGQFLDLSVEESDDSGTNWFKVYDFPRITATGMYRSPILRSRGNRVRFVQTLGGTTPSFTRSINRLQLSGSNSQISQLVDRTIAPNTLNSTSPTLNVEGCQDFNMSVRITAQTTAATIAIQFSDDGTNFHTS
ncbi:MAG TPA: hypothetical protein DCE71_05460, partial [Parachlamydiales bacterium]|nr:hypothetical protein [Parachlamydiales bacterium]